MSMSITLVASCPGWGCQASFFLSPSTAHPISCLCLAFFDHFPPDFPSSFPPLPIHLLFLILSISSPSAFLLHTCFGCSLLISILLQPFSSVLLSPCPPPSLHPSLCFPPSSSLSPPHPQHQPINFYGLVQAAGSFLQLTPFSHSSFSPTNGNELSLSYDSHNPSLATLWHLRVPHVISLQFWTETCLIGEQPHPQRGVHHILHLERG